jgi:hypothetical protein
MKRDETRKFRMESKWGKQNNAKAKEAAAGLCYGCLQRGHQIAKEHIWTHMIEPRCPAALNKITKAQKLIYPFGVKNDTFMQKFIHTRAALRTRFCLQALLI